VIINDVELWVEHPRPIPRTCSKHGFFSANGFQEMNSKVEELSSVSFKLKEFRSTLTSITVNGDTSPLPAMSAQLRYASMTATGKEGRFLKKRKVEKEEVWNLLDPDPGSQCRPLLLSSW